MKYSILILLVFFSFSVIAETETRTRVGKAFDLNTGELIYTESHNETYKAGIIISDEVIYRDTSNNIIAIKKVDYSNGMIMPDFMLKNMETGHIESALKEADRLKVVFSKNKNDLKKESVIPLPDKAIIDAGFDQFIIEHWDEIMQVNLKSCFNTVKAASRTLMKQRSGSIINMSSVVGVKGNAGQANYAASKAGIIGFSKSVALEFGSRNIRSNVIAPGFIETEMTANLDEKTLETWRSGIPLKRGGTPEDVANCCVFLASDASTYITGQVIGVDGGMNT